MIRGVDVHAGYGSIAWGDVAASGVRFAIAKCTEGNAGKDPSFDRNFAGMHANGVIAGAYLFAYPLRDDPAHPGRSPKEQAERFWRDSKGLGARSGELPPALDFEWPARFDTRYRDAAGRLGDRWKHWNVDAEFIVAWTLECVAEIERLWGRVPLLYTYPYFMRDLGVWGKVPELARLPLWIASYPATAAAIAEPAPSLKPLVPEPWTSWAVWQFAGNDSTYRIPGIGVQAVDRNVIRDEATLRSLAGLDGADATPPEGVPEMRADPLESVTINDFAIVHKSPYDDEPPDSAA